MRDRFEAKNPHAWMLRFHTQTAGCTLTAQQPDNNIVRVALQALAAVLGGTQSLHTNSMDEALWLPTEKAVRVALRTQQILAEEAGVGDTVDPLGGSYLIEHLTDEIEQNAMEYINKIDEMGGALAAIENNYVQNEIHNSAYRFQQALEAGDEVIVGVNAHQIKEEIDLERLEVDPAIETAAKGHLKNLRSGRDANKTSELLTRLEKTIHSSENLLPLFIECVDNNITLGEICKVLRQEWGEYSPSG
jgi:methylmalonyl-CoA mutase N-terminal domain/subunit